MSPFSKHKTVLSFSFIPTERLPYLKAASYICVKTSYRDATDILNHFLGRPEEDKIKLRTLADCIGRTGNEISKELSVVIACVLTMYGFDDETGLPRKGVVLSDNVTTPAVSDSLEIDEKRIQEALDDVNTVWIKRVSELVQEYGKM